MALGFIYLQNVRGDDMKKFSKNIHLRLGEKSYDIFVGSNKVNIFGRLIKSLNIGTDSIVITNRDIKRLLGKKLERSLSSAGFKVKFILVPDSERAKSERYCIKLLNDISIYDNSKRRLFIVALGGGVIGDLAGFVASVYRRGIPYVQVPTTLLAQVDSSIGGKVAIDLKAGKNLVGAFYQPRTVLMDTYILKTLPKRDFISGMAEIIKYSIIRSPEFFDFLDKHMDEILSLDDRCLRYIVYTCAKIKADIVAKDEYDRKNLRVVLNLGHTIGHAIEAAFEYSKAYSHGEAVALGMISACYMSRELGLLTTGDFLKIKDLIKKAGLPYRLKKTNISKIMSIQEHDKKFIHGMNRFVLPVKIGKVVVRENIPVKVVKDSVSALFRT